MTIRKLVGTLENKEPYIDQKTGHWFYWNGTKYVDSGYPYAVKPIISFKIEDGILYYSIIGRYIEYIKYFETLEEYESWVNIEDNAKEVYRTEEKICVDGIILSYTNEPYEEK